MLIPKETASDDLNEFAISRKVSRPHLSIEIDQTVINSDASP